jgi:DNA-binding transcriptional regulator LsrR (DeoR family)
MSQVLSKLFIQHLMQDSDSAYLAVSHFIDGKNRTKISEYLKVSRTRVNKWVRDYLTQYISKLTEEKHTGHQKGLTEIQYINLKISLLLR